MQRMVSIHEQGIAIVDVPLRRATAESLQGYGRFVESFAEADVNIVTWPRSRLAAGRTGNVYLSVPLSIPE